jgi:acetyl esterase/lipase
MFRAFNDEREERTFRELKLAEFQGSTSTALHEAGQRRTSETHFQQAVQGGRAMRLSRRVKGVAWVALAALLLSASWIAFRILTHGIPALLRADVSSPAARIRYGPSSSQLLDVRVPAGQGPFPVVVLIHGGCWNMEFGSPAHMAPLAQALLERGVASINVEYRRVGEPGGGWPGTFRDIGAAIDAVRTIGPRYNTR